MKLVPTNRILLESDWNACHPHTEAMIEIIKLVSFAKGWEHSQTISITQKNAIEFFRLEDVNEK